MRKWSEKELEDYICSPAPTTWDDRHTDADGEDVHEGCCELCKTNQT